MSESVNFWESLCAGMPYCPGEVPARRAGALRIFAINKMHLPGNSEATCA